jgi:acetate kinase
VLVRQQICTDLKQIGIELASEANAGAKGIEADISSFDSKVRVFVVPTDEEAAIAHDTYELAGKKEVIICLSQTPMGISHKNK